MRSFYLLSLMILPEIASASGVCPEGGLMDGPLGISFFEGDIGRPRRVCPRTELAIVGGVAAVDVADDLIAEDGNFYATMGGGGEVSGSWRYSERGEFFASFQALNVRFVQNATLTGTRTGLGWASLGITHQGFRTDRLILAATARLTLPTALGYYENAWPLALDAGFVALLRFHKVLWVHGGIGASASMAVGEGDSGARAALQVLAGIEYAPLDWLGLVLDLEALLGYGAPLDRFSAALGVRFRIWQGLGVELGGLLPFAGSSEDDLAIVLRVGYRFGV